MICNNTILDKINNFCQASIFLIQHLELPVLRIFYLALGVVKVSRYILELGG